VRGADGAKVKVELEKARGALRLLERVGQRLMRPSVEALNTSAVDLTRVAGSLEWLESELTSRRRTESDQRALTFEIAGIQRELERACELVAYAGQFYAGWAALVSSGAEQETVQYTVAGRAHAISIDTGKVVMHG
jgi:hypothetical protein